MSGKIIGFINNDHSLTPVALRQVMAELPLASQDWGGIGVGWLQDGRALERKNPRITGGAHDPLGLLADIPSREVVAFVTPQILGSAASLQPHRFRTWLYAEGQCPEALDARTEELIAQLPDFLQHHVPAGAPAAARFLSVLHEVFDQDSFHGASQRRERSASAVVQGVGQLMERFEGALSPYTALVATERMMCAINVGQPLYCRLWHGIEEPAPKALFAGHRTRPTAHPHYRALLITDEQPSSMQGWQEVAPGHVVFLGDGWKVRTTPLPF